MALSRLDNRDNFDYSFKYKTGVVKHKGLQLASLVFSNPKYQGSIPTEVISFGFAIPFNLSPEGIRELRKRKFKVVNLKGVGLSKLLNLNDHMDKMIEQKPKVNV